MPKINKNLDKALPILPKISLDLKKVMNNYKGELAVLDVFLIES